MAESVVGRLLRLQIYMLDEMNARARFGAILRNAAVVFGVGAALFVGLHLVPRYLFNVYGLFWGTLVPIVAGLIAGLSGILLVLLSLWLGFLRLRMMTTMAGVRIFCQVCGKKAPLDKERVDSLAKTFQRTAGSSGGEENSIPRVLCSDKCEQIASELGKDWNGGSHCWSCGEKASLSGGLCGICGFVVHSLRGG